MGFEQEMLYRVMKLGIPALASYHKQARSTSGLLCGSGQQVPLLR